MKRNNSEPRREAMGGLAKGLDVIRAFTQDAPSLTLSEVASRAKLPAATARRCLLTLAELGYVMQSGRNFLLRPKVLELGAAYLESMNIETLTKTYLEDLASQTGDSAALTVLDGTEVVYVARPFASSGCPDTADPKAKNVTVPFGVTAGWASSVTVAVYVPGSMYRWAARRRSACPPSPKSQA